ncbi:MAG: hypothetical protein IJ927_04580, partial [Eubacterium sp.]|nr:hypothetical protein [Eubacterium sp.]
MTEYILFGIVIVLLLAVLIAVLTKKPKSDNSAQLLNQKLDMVAAQNQKDLNTISNQMKDLTNKNYEQQIKLMETLNVNAEKQTKAIAEAISSMQKSNEEKLEVMRKTVDEKLTETLNTRLNASFKTVSEQLSNVYKSLGEMKELS